MDNPSIFERLKVLGFSDDAAQDFADQVPSVSSLTRLSAALVFIRFVSSIFLGILLTGLIYIMSIFVLDDFGYVCGIDDLSNAKLASFIQYFASLSAVGLAERLLVPRASKSFQIRYHLRPLLLMYSTGNGPGAVRRILKKHPHCRTADNFLEAWNTSSMKQLFWFWIAVQIAVPAAYFLVPTVCA